MKELVEEIKFFIEHIQPRVGEVAFNDIYGKITELEQLVNNNCDLAGVSGCLPTKKQVVAEGEKQINEWLGDNTENERLAYKVAFRRSFEYVLRCIQ